MIVLLSIKDVNYFNYYKQPKHNSLLNLANTVRMVLFQERLKQVTIPSAKAK